METRHLRIFVAVYRLRSFTRAAEALFTSQPTVSEHMKHFEEELGCRLFDRLGRSISPTPAADLLYPRALEILAQMEKLTQTLSSAAETVSGHLVIGASTIPGEYIVPRIAATFRDSYPDVSFAVLINDSANIVNDIRDHRLYLGVVGAELPVARVSFTPFGGDELVLAARQDARIEAEITARELPQLDFLVREKGSGTGRHVERFLGSIGIKMASMRVRAELGSSTAIKEAVKSGLGAAIISRAAIREELASGVLKTVAIEGLTMARSFYIVTPEKRTLPHHYQVFADFLRSSATESGAYPLSGHPGP